VEHFIEHGKKKTWTSRISHKNIFCASFD